MPFLFDFVLRNISIEQFDALMDKAAPWKWKDVDAGQKIWIDGPGRRGDHPGQDCLLDTT